LVGQLIVVTGFELPSIPLSAVAYVCRSNAQAIAGRAVLHGVLPLPVTQ
jgi:hypothetical protein